MTDVTNPLPLSAAFARVLTARKRDFVTTLDDPGSAETALVQHGAARIDGADFPGWPDLECQPDAEAIIETFVADGAGLTPMSDNQPFVSTWQPLASWIDRTVRAALATHEVELVGPAYVTASLTSIDTLEGVPHADDHQFVPDENVGVVAIIGQQAGPRIATHPLEHGPLQPMTHVTFEAHQLQSFAAGNTPHCACSADQLVVFPQFAQLHAGPAGHDLGRDPHDGLGRHRQLLVYRAIAAT